MNVALLLIMVLFYTSPNTFRDNYNDAREQFITSSTTGKHYALTVDTNETIDVIVFKGRSNKLLLHISGTHGVEGFVGSAIQSHVLKNYTHEPRGPTVIFVHALNPFGMKYMRRANQNNVDLNRNALFTTQEWQHVRQQLPTHNRKLTYSDLNDIINP